MTGRTPASDAHHGAMCEPDVNLERTTGAFAPDEGDISDMAYVIVDGCSKDEKCVEACPTDCIHPKKDEEKFATAEQMYVDPEGCIDCGACVAVCPTNSIFAEADVAPEKADYIEKNKAFYA